MSILLPSSPGIRAGKPRLLDFGGTLTPPLGGPAQKLNRLGNRFQLDVELATSPGDTTGRIFVNRLLRALTAGAILPFPQDMDSGLPGTPVVDGAGQLGSSLQLRGFTPGYQVLEGQFFSIIYGGRRYLHAAADNVATGTGQLVLPIVPMLRISPNDGATCEFGQPMIEGFLSGNSQEWALQRDPYLDISFTITEAA